MVKIYGVYNDKYCSVCSYTGKAGEALAVEMPEPVARFLLQASRALNDMKIALSQEPIIYEFNGGSMEFRFPGLRVWVLENQLPTDAPDDYEEGMEFLPDDIPVAGELSNVWAEVRNDGMCLIHDAEGYTTVDLAYIVRECGKDKVPL